MSELKKYLATPSGDRAHRAVIEQGFELPMITDTSEDVIIMAASREEADAICEEFHEGVGVIGTPPVFTGFYDPSTELAIHYNLGLS
jgi:hypothetical protein